MEEEPNPRYKLYQLLQRLVGRPLTLHDIVITHQTWQVGIQATVTLVCAEGKEAASELCPTAKEAEESACHQALLIYGDEIRELIAKLPAPPPPGKRKGTLVLPPIKRQALAAPLRSPTKLLVATPKPVARPADPVERKEENGVADEADVHQTDHTEEDAPAEEAGPLDGLTEEEVSALSEATAKSKPQPPPGAALIRLPETSPQPATDVFRAQPKQDLNALCGKIARKVMNKGEVAYTTLQVLGGYQSTVTLKCFDGDWADAAFVGQVHPQKTGAEHSAASVALAELCADEQMLSRLTLQTLDITWLQFASANYVMEFLETADPSCNSMTSQTSMSMQTSTVVFGKLREVIGRPSTSTSKLDWVKQRKSLLVLGIFRFFVAVMGLISLRYVAASFTETIKASSPFFTVVAAWFLTGERTPLPVLITLVPVMLGLITAAAGEHSFAVVGFVAAVLANLAECVQNVFCSQLLQPGPDGARFTSGQLQYYSACASLVVQIPFFGAAFLQGSLVLPNAALQWAWLLIAGFVYFLQSALAFKIMSCYSPVTLSVMNTAKRALIICFSAHYFGNVITNTALRDTQHGFDREQGSTIRRTAEDGKARAQMWEVRWMTVDERHERQQELVHGSRPRGHKEACMTAVWQSHGYMERAATGGDRSLSSRTLQFPSEGPRQVFTCGCGHLSAELLCSLLLQRGIASVLDVRELDHSTKRPWFNSEALEETMAKAGLAYRYLGQRDDSWAPVVAAALLELPPPRCLLGLRALARECPRLRLAQHLTEMDWEVVHLQPSPEAPPSLTLLEYQHTEVFARQARLAHHIATVTASLEAQMGFYTTWQQRIHARYRVVSWDTWDTTRHFPAPGEQALVIALPFDTSLVAIPGFLSKSEIFSLQQATLPGALNYEQPRRQVRNPDGSFTHFNERHKEAWICNGYDYRDTRRVAPPRLHVGQKVAGKVEEILQRAAEAICSPLNGMMCRWEPPGVHLKDGPHTYATHCGWGSDCVIALMAVGATRVYHIHGIPWYYGRGRREVASVNIPLEEGLLVALGGPLREKWLYSQPRDEEILPERVQFTMQLHADAQVMKGGDQAAADSWTEDCEGRSRSLSQLRHGL
ncbi:SLC35E2B [Symbiodinium sp. CCMP2592]|nr:SLC35E2B [Symbiodinium sp. CCMP2592]